MYQSDNGAFNFYFNAKKETVELARELRKKMTPAEMVLWEKLRNRQLLGFKFRRQHPVDIFVVDFPQIMEYFRHAAPLVIREEKMTRQPDGCFNRQKYIVRYRK